MSSIELRRSEDRIRTDMGWLQARGSFPMGHHPPDPDNTHFGLLYVHQENRIAPHSGFPAHPHRGVEVVTWMLEGALEHGDSIGASGVIEAGHTIHSPRLRPRLAHPRQKHAEAPADRLSRSGPLK